MTELFQTLCEKRGVGEEFLHPKYEDLADPFGLPDMEAATERILAARDRGEKVLIYGDYDVDGVTATTAMYDTLRLVGVKEVGVMLPDRFRDGYGMSERVVERAVNDGVGLVVTVDCGSRNQEIIEKLLSKKINVVVTDHHECGGELPECPVVNPKRTGVEKSASAEVSSDREAQVKPLKTGVMRDLAGVGVVFEVARALVKKGALPAGQEKWLLDLVMIGTLCDSMRISRENRILTYWGLKVLAKTRRPGLVELMRVAHVKNLDAETVGFKIGPRLNAAGRLKSAEMALELLMTRDPVRAAQLAVDLNTLNNRRRDVQIKAIEEIRRRGLPEERPVLVVTGNWHEGVLGIIAGRLVEEYHRPAFVLAKADTDGDGIVDVVYKGSGRSFGEFNLAEALSACADSIIGGGGHAEACGLKVSGRKLAEFEEAVNEYYGSLGLKDQERFLCEQEDLALTDLRPVTVEFVQELGGLEPFGVGNQQPVFLLAGAKVLEARRLGQQGEHLSLYVEGKDGGRMKLIAFGAKEEWLRVTPEMVLDLQVHLANNEYRGLVSVEGELLDLKVTGVAGA